MKAMRIGLALLGLACAALQRGELSAQDRPSGFLTWEYRVLTKDQVLALGQKELVAGLNRLGEQGWELAAVDSAYIFKRAKDQTAMQLGELNLRFEAAKSDVDDWRGRSAWSSRMAKKGLMAQAQADSDKSRLRISELALDLIRKQIEAVSGTAKKQEEKLPMPKD
jgi:hypothetical protein